jgi:hypothetical protein
MTGVHKCVPCLVENSEGKMPFGRYRYGDNIKMDVKLRTRLIWIERCGAPCSAISIYTKLRIPSAVEIWTLPDSMLPH